MQFKKSASNRCLNEHNSSKHELVFYYFKLKKIFIYNWNLSSSYNLSNLLLLMIQIMLLINYDTKTTSTGVIVNCLIDV